MDLGLFSTQLAQGSKVALSGNGLLGGNGLFGAQAGVDFWNIILGQLGEETGEVKTDTQDGTHEGIKNKIQKEKADLALLQLALLGQDPDKNIDEKLAELRIERINDNRNNRVEQLTKLINHLTNGLPATTEGNGNIDELVSRLERRLEKLESRLEAFRTGDFGDEGQPFRLLIATGLNPAQITKITQRIEEVENKLGRELTAEDLIAGVGNIVPAPGDDDHKFSSTDAIGLILNKTKEEKDVVRADQKQTDTEKRIEEKTQKEDQPVVGVDAALHIENETVVIAQHGKPSFGKPTTRPVYGPTLPREIIDQAAARPSSTPLGTQPITDPDAPTSPLSKPLPESMSNAEFKALFGNTKPTNGNTIKTNNLNFSRPAETKANPITPAITMPPGWAEAMTTQSIMSDALGFDIQTGAPFTSTMQAAHAVSSSTQAGQMHPATQTVSAHLTKAASNGDGRRMTLQLDPPELGRVEVRLEFGKDKSVKAHLIIEKPETYLMLQRDSVALDRALQNAGLETDGNSLDYQMAADDYAFNTGSDNNGNGNSNGSSSQEGEETDAVIETTMSWVVDAETGHTSYNILA